MSILLDALKKSEEQRQLGTTPDIHAPGDHNPEEPRFTAPPWLPGAMMATAVVVIGWLIWGQFREPDVSTVSGSPEVSQKSTVAAVEDRGDKVQTGQEQRTPVETFTAEPPEAGGAQGPANQADEQRRELARTFEQYREPEPEPGTGPGLEIKDTPSVEQPPAGTRTETRPATQERPSAAQNRPAARTPLQPHVSQPIPFWELPQNVRDSMPDLRITVMVYAEVPEDRFILVNGVRLREKESMDGVQLEEIRRNGAVFRYRTYRFLVEG